MADNLNSSNLNLIDKDKLDKINQANLSAQNKQSEQNEKSNNQVVDLLDFDMLKMYFGEPYKVNDYITIQVPTIGDIIEFGENEFWSAVTPFTGNTTTYRVALWKVGIDWNKISDYELFVQLCHTLTPKSTQLIFGDFDFSSLVPMKQMDTEKVLLCNPKTLETVIDEITYVRLAEYIRMMFNQHPKVQFAKGKTAKEMIIRKDENERLKAEKESKGSYLLSLVSSLVNHPGFKYKQSELKELNIVAFMDSVNRLQVYEQSTAYLKGLYSGFIDTSKIPDSQLNKNINWLRDLNS